MKSNEMNKSLKNTKDQVSKERITNGLVEYQKKKQEISNSW